MECPYCKYENRDGVRYCSNCGRALSPVTTTNTSTGGTSRSLAIGTPLQGGRYVITKILGEGGMGTAVLATDKRTDNKLVVIKELVSDNTDPAKFQEDVRNFKREVATLAHLDHPLISYVTDSFEEDSRYFMVQKYIEGENIEERMDRVNQTMKELELLGLSSVLLDILDYLSHQTPPIVHRDIKPANIIIGAKDKRAHLVDFGIARADIALNARRKQTSALGTPGYAPPEQYQGNADPRSDLYALGATLHYVLTNRDPRNHPPFVYPPVRSLNPQLSPETDRVLNRALVSDINQRYQSAAAMKQDIYNILQNRYGVMGNASSYTLNTSGQMAAIGAAPTIVNQPTWVQPPTQPAPPPPALPPYPYQPQPQPSGSHRGRNILLVLLAILLIVGVAYAAFTRFLRPGAGVTSTPTPVVLHGIGVTKAPDGEFIGISDGTVAFDTNRPDGNLKRQAADRLKAGDVSGAESLWQSGLQQDTSDAEALIYLENQRVLNSGNPHITLVAGTMITGDNIGVGRDDLQGAYIAQKEFNDGFKLPNNVQVILLVANSGNDATYATTVAQQIVQAAQQDHSIVGVMGWPFSSRAINVVKVLAAAHIPMVSQTASSDLLSQVSPYFFRVAPSNNGQAIAGARYAEQVLHAKNVALFVDPSDSYSSSLATDFSRQFKADGNTIVVTENYTVGASGRGKLPALLQDALNHSPDLVYFSGYPSSARVGFNRLHFTAFAYPDEWEIAGLRAQKPAFFTDYANAFNPTGQEPGGAYGYTRTDNDVMLSYDATLALLTGSKLALSTSGGNKKSITPDELQQGLAKITGAQALQGVSGRIAFGPDGNPVDKAFVILFVDALGRIHEESLRGCFQVGACT